MHRVAKWDVAAIALSLMLSMIISAFAQGTSTQPPSANLSANASDIKCTSPRVKLDEEGFVSLGGISQWVTIHGASCANPVVLFLHGGPGNALSPYSHTVYGAWEKEFSLVQWDQRGAGVTYDRNPQLAVAPLTVERMAQDGIELAAYLTQRLGKRKIILMGGSWGSILGIHMTKLRPDLFYAYVGTGQMVSYRDNPAAGYAKLLAVARAASDMKTVTAIEALGPPPWQNPRNSGIMRRATRAYEAKSTTPAPAGWWVPAPAYATPKLQASFEAADDYSYLQFVGMKGDGMYSRVDLPALGRNFEIPVFFIQGSEDLVTVPEVAKRYFDNISAPQKEYVLVLKTGHDPNPAMVEAQYKILKDRIAPLVR